MLEATYTAPDGSTLYWRTFCEDDCKMYPRPIVCRNCQYEPGFMRCTNPAGVRQWFVRGVIVATTIKRAKAELRRNALEAMQPVLFEMEER